MNTIETGDLSSRCEVLVLGAGISGLAAARELASEGRDVIVADRSDICGGAHRSASIGAMTFDVGSVFFEPGAELFAAFPETREMCLPVVRRQRRIAPDGRLRHYPFDPAEIRGWPPGAVAAVAAELLLRGISRGGSSVESQCVRRMGRTIYRRSGLEAYVTRFHQDAPARVDGEFFRRRMGFVDRSTGAAAILRRLRGGATPAAAPATLLVRPQAGFASLYAVVQAALERQGVRFRLGTAIEGIRRDDGKLIATTAAGPITADRIVAAMPLGAVHAMAFGADIGLEGLDLLTLFVSAPDGRAPACNVLFNFHPEGRWKRLTLYSGIYPEAAPGRTFFAVEVTLPHGRTSDPEAAFDDFARHVVGLGVFSAGLKLEGHAVVPDAYPVYRTGTADTVAAAVARLTALGVAPVGRQGRFAYLPTSSQVIRAVREEIAAAGIGESRRAI